MESRVLPVEAIHMQLTKLKAATASHTRPCHQRRANPSSNSARQNSQNTTTLPVESAISGACQADTAGSAPIPAVAACAAGVVIVLEYRNLYVTYITAYGDALRAGIVVSIAGAALLLIGAAMLLVRQLRAR